MRLLKRSGWLFSAIFALGMTFALTRGVLALGISSKSVQFDSVSLNGSDQIISGSTSAWRIDASDTAGGWNVIVQADDFSDGYGHFIDSTNLAIRLLNEKITVISGEGGPASTQTSYTSLGNGWVKIISSPENVGMGIYDITPDFSLFVPAQTYSGSYTATITVSVVTGP